MNTHTENVAKLRALELPDTLSGLLRLAVKDAQEVFRQPNIEPDMNLWVRPPLGERPCTVCLAGAVMLKEADLDVGEGSGYLFADNAGVRNGNKFCAIDSLRKLDFEEASGYYRHFKTKGRGCVASKHAAAILHMVSNRERELFNRRGYYSFSLYNRVANTLEALGY